MAIFVTKPVPFLKQFLNRFDTLNYPKSRLKVHVYSLTNYHEKDIKTWADGNEVDVTIFSEQNTEADARNHAM